jgi:hypothetical protein
MSKLCCISVLRFVSVGFLDLYAFVFSILLFFELVICCWFMFLASMGCGATTLVFNLVAPPPIPRMPTLLDAKTTAK